MRFDRLFQGIDLLWTDATPDMEILGIEHDSRRVEPGSAFFCLEGYKQDGHAFIDSAIDNGASLIVSERRLQKRDSVRVAQVADSRLALALAASNFFGNPSSRLLTIGITGTNGKTTTANLVRSILQSAGRKVALLGTISHQIGDEIISAQNTTPDALDLQKMMNRALSRSLDSFVMEVSSHALELKRVEGIGYDVGVFTNLTWDHLDFHGTIDNYRAAKLHLIDLLKPDGTMVINADDPASRYFIDKTSQANRRHITFGVKSNDVDVFGQIEKLDVSGSIVIVHAPNMEMRIAIKLIGEHNVYNVLSAIGVGLAIGIDPDSVREGIESFRRVPGRFDPVDLGQNFSVVVDYAHTPDALEKVLTNARKITNGRLICVFGCGGDRDNAKRPQMGRIATELADFTVVTSDNPRTEDPNRIIDQICRGINANSNRYQVEPDREKAIATAIRLARAGDFVLIAGKGHEDYQIIGTRKIPFDDREVASRYIKEVINETHSG